VTIFRQRLDDVPTPERHLWANSYDRKTSDVLALHSEIAGGVAKEIKISLTPQEETRLAESRTVNPAAHESYLRARYSLDRRTKEDTEKLRWTRCSLPRMQVLRRDTLRWHFTFPVNRRS